MSATGSPCTATPASARSASRRSRARRTSASSGGGSSPSLPAEPRRLLLGAFGDPGHAFPMIALGRELAARGHDVVLQTWRRWEEHVVAEGMRFAAAPEYHVFPTLERPLAPYEAVVRAAGDTRPLVAELRPDAVVAAILTLAPALAAELEGVPVATLVPHTDPRRAPGFPPYSLGARLPRTALGRGLWRGNRPLLAGGRSKGGAGCGGRPTGSSAWGSNGGASSSTRPARASACRRSRMSTAGSPGRSRWWRRPRSSSTHAPGTARRTSSGRCCGSRRAVRSASRRATDRSCSSRRRRRRTAAAGSCAPRSRGSPACRFACWPAPTARRLPP